LTILTRFDDFQSVEAGYALVVSSVAKALRRLTMGPKEFFNLVNSHKQFFVTRSDVALGVQKLSDFQVPESHPALQKLLGKLDPEGYGELTLPMLKKFWLPEFKTATAVKASVRAKAKSSTFEERHMQHPTLSKNNRGSSLTSNPKSPRSTGGWGNRTVRVGFSTAPSTRHPPRKQHPHNLTDYTVLPNLRETLPQGKTLYSTYIHTYTHVYITL